MLKPRALTLVSVLGVSLLPWFGWAETDSRSLAKDLQQGGFKLLDVPQGARVTLGGAPLLTVPLEGGRAAVLVGFDRFEQPERWLQVCVPGAPSCQSTRLKITARTYRTQNVRGVSRQHLAPDPKQQARMAADRAAIQAARRELVAAAQRGRTAGGLGFLQTFIRPTSGPETGVYGSRRLFEGAERSWHKGVDYGAPTGTPVVAPADGVVRLARDTFMSGNLIMLDHGGGLETLYAHLHTMEVKPGDVVRQGARIGTVGNTGRSSGPHLHWGMYWSGTNPAEGHMAIDPALWLPPTAATRKEP